MHFQELTPPAFSFDIQVADQKRRKHSENIKTIYKVILTTSLLISAANIFLEPDPVF